MTTFADQFKREVVRLAKKQVKSEMESLLATTRLLKKEVTELKHRLSSLEKTQRQVAKARRPAVEQEGTEATKAAQSAFSSEKFVSMRKRLGLTQKQASLLLGVSTLSVYKWETGTVQPRSGAIARIEQLSKQSKREVATALAQVGEV
jgi:DNA-binding transcriptional regulator YiaG